jgi:hypothetical protein
MITISANNAIPHVSSASSKQITVLAAIQQNYLCLINPFASVWTDFTCLITSVLVKLLS